mgnify:FL=1
MQVECFRKNRVATAKKPERIIDLTLSPKFNARIIIKAHLINGDDAALLSCTDIKLFCPGRPTFCTILFSSF